MSNIPFLDLKANYKTIKDQVNSNIQQVLDNCDFIMGSKVKEFENHFASYIGVKHCIGVANGPTNTFSFKWHPYKLHGCTTFTPSSEITFGPKFSFFIII